MPLNPLERVLLNVLIKYKVKNTSILVAVSGGVDSMVLAHALLAIKDKLKLNLNFAHIHHGAPKNIPKTQLVFRDRAMVMVRGLAQTSRVLIAHAGESELKSEADFRAFRYSCLKKWTNDFEFPFVLTAHNQDDVLETRLLRLVRGVGERGFLGLREKRAMTTQSQLIRPFLKVPRYEIEAYAQSKNISYVEDPSNQNLTPLRNWMRQVWIKSLRERDADAPQRLTRSFEQLELGLRLDRRYTRTLVRKLRIQKNTKVSREKYNSLTQQDRQRVLAYYLRTFSQFDFKRSHVEELRKRLDTGHPGFTFRLCGQNWTVTPRYFWCHIK